MNATIGERLKFYRGIGPGFDLLRLGLSGSILFIHCFVIATGVREVVTATGFPISAAAPSSGTETWARWLADLLLHRHNNDAHIANLFVPMFFALSGFLVTASAYRTGLVIKFLGFRALRILPALVVEVTLSALILGAAFTALAPADYFSDPRFFSYFGNIVGHVQFDLPGVFLGNPQSGIVNGNLWTLPPEFYCYLIIGAALLTKVIFKRTLFSTFVLVAICAVVFWDIQSGDQYKEGFLRNSVFAVTYFFCGCVTYQWRDYIPLRGWMFAAAIFAIYLNIVSVPAMHAVLQYVMLPAVTYMTIYIGFIKFPRIELLQGGDYSYGVYLYGYPITQALIAMNPDFRGHPLLLLSASLPATFMFAWISWHLFEKRALKLKNAVFLRPAPATARAPDF